MDSRVLKNNIENVIQDDDNISKEPYGWVEDFEFNDKYSDDPSLFTGLIIKYRVPKVNFEKHQAKQNIIMQLKERNISPIIKRRISCCIIL